MSEIDYSKIDHAELEKAYQAARAGGNGGPDLIIGDVDLIPEPYRAKVKAFESANPGVDWTLDFGTGEITSACPR